MKAENKKYTINILSSTDDFLYRFCTDDISTILNTIFAEMQNITFKINSNDFEMTITIMDGRSLKETAFKFDDFIGKLSFDKFIEKVCKEYGNEYYINKGTQYCDAFESEKDISLPIPGGIEYRFYKSGRM